MHVVFWLIGSVHRKEMDRKRFIQSLSLSQLQLCRWRHHKGPSRKWGSFVLSTLWMLEWCYGECMTHVRQLQVPWNFFRCNTPLKYFTYNHTIFYVRDFRRRGESVTFCDSPRLTAILGTPWGYCSWGGLSKVYLSTSEVGREPQTFLHLCCVAYSACSCDPWDEAAKLEKVLADFWREVPDLHLREGTSCRVR